MISVQAYHFIIIVEGWCLHHYIMPGVVWQLLQLSHQVDMDEPIHRTLKKRTDDSDSASLRKFINLVWDRMKSPLLEVKARRVIANRTDDKCLPSSHPFGAQTFPSGGIHQSHRTYRCFLKFVECFSKDLPKLQFSQWMNFIGSNSCFWFGFVHHTTFSVFKPHLFKRSFRGASFTSTTYVTNILFLICYIIVVHFKFHTHQYPVQTFETVTIAFNTLEPQNKKNCGGADFTNLPSFTSANRTVAWKFLLHCLALRFPSFFYMKRLKCVLSTLPVAEDFTVKLIHPTYYPHISESSWQKLRYGTFCTFQPHYRTGYVNWRYP